MSALDLRAAGGQLSTSSCGRPHLGGRCKSSQHMPNEQPLQKVRVSARSSGRQSPGPVQKTSPVGRGRVVSALVLDFYGVAARAWCIMVHQLGVPHPSMPHQKSLYPPTCPVTRVVMGAGPQQRGRGSVTGLGLCAGKGRCRHLPAVARRGLERRPRKRAGKRRAHARKHEKLGGWASYGLRQCGPRPRPCSPAESCSRPPSRAGR